MVTLAAISLAFSAQLGAASLPPDSVRALAGRARAAEAAYERLSRRLAPFTWGAPAGYECDEIVGRFCLRFDSGTPRPTAADQERGRIVDARRDAVEAARRFFSAAPGERRAAGPLVRLLLRDGRASEAVSAAGAFAALTPDSLWADLLLGLAQHASGDDAAAERHFIAALARMRESERSRWLDPSWLLDPDERSRFRRLPGSARTEYERRFWLLADPFWSTPANERWIGHIARHVDARLLADVPIVAGMVRWGRDLDELTVRYGTPTSRSQTRPTSLNADASFIEYWDTAQRAFDPARLLAAGYAEPPLPGERPALYRPDARSSFTVNAVDRVLELSHQATRFIRDGEPAIRVDAALGGMAGSEAPPAAGLFAYDSAFTVRRAASTTALLDGDTARFMLIVPAPGARIAYSAELIGDSSRPAGRARYAIDAVLPAAGPILSDLLICEPLPRGFEPDGLADPRLAGVAELIFRPGDTIGLVAEVYHARLDGPLAVEVVLEAGRPSLLRQFGRWIGRTLGVIQPTEDPRVSFREEPDGPVQAIALNLPLDPRRTGEYTLVVRVTDADGEPTEARRPILIRE